MVVQEAGSQLKRTRSGMSTQAYDFITVLSLLWCTTNACSALLQHPGDGKGRLAAVGYGTKLGIQGLEQATHERQSRRPTHRIRMHPMK